MLLRKAIHKSKMFFHKTLRGLKSFRFGGYQKLPKARPLNPLLCNPNMQDLDQFFRGFSEHWESQNEKVRGKKSAMAAKERIKEEDASNGSFMKFARKNALKEKHEERKKEDNKIGSSGEGTGGEACSEIVIEGVCVLAQKMEELEMMDMEDADHVLDIEEVLHCYSLLNCPVYLDIVDNFFIDLYSEFFLPKQPSVGISRSSRRLGTLKF